MSRHPPRFWTWYALAWVPYLAFAMLAYTSGGETRPWTVLKGGLTSVLPLALLGVGAIRVCRRLPWTPGASGRFFAAHAGFAALYAVLVVASQTAVYVALASARRGALTFETVVPGIVLWQLLMAVIVYAALAGVTSTLEAHTRLREEEERSARAHALRTEAELAALRAQLNPHFLFNTLHTLLALVREDPARAERALEQFGDLLRYALRVQQETRDEGTLAEEWRFIGDYLALEQLRLGDRLRVEVAIAPEALGCVVPVFCLQPLVENAVQHGVARRATGGRITIAARLDDGHVELRVTDDGAGAGPGVVEAARGMGIRLVRRRLEALYAGAATLAVEPRPSGDGFAVRVRLPVRRTS